MLSDKVEIPEHLRLSSTDTDAERLAKRKRVKAIKSAHKVKKIELERSLKQSKWQDFQKKKLPKKKSMFKTPDAFDGRVGVVGSGKPLTSYQHIGKFKYVYRVVPVPFLIVPNVSHLRK